MPAVTVITLDAAQDALAAGIAEAERRGEAVSVAVVDAGGVLRAGVIAVEPLELER